MADRFPQLVVVGRGASGREFLACAAENALSDHYRIRVLDERGTGSGSERETVLTIDPARHLLETVSGRTLEYGALVLATGQRPPPVPATRKIERYLTYRHPADLGAIRDEGSRSHRAVIVGGGQSGLHVAQLLSGLGLKTHIVEAKSRLLHDWIDETGAIVLHSRVSKAGVEVHVGQSLARIPFGKGIRHDDERAGRWSAPFRWQRDRSRSRGGLPACASTR